MSAETTNSQSTSLQSPYSQDFRPVEGGLTFTKLDLAYAYQQIHEVLEEEDDLLQSGRYSLQEVLHGSLR